MNLLIPPWVLQMVTEEVHTSVACASYFLNVGMLQEEPRGDGERPVLIWEQKDCKRG